MLTIVSISAYCPVLVQTLTAGAHNEVESGRKGGA